MFILNGASFASWAGRIPTVREDLGISSGQLGVMLLLGAAGSLVGMPFAGKLVTAYGAARTVLIGAALAELSFVAVAITVGVLHSLPATLPFLFLSMAGIGVWDVSMNMEGVEVERRLGRTIMPRYHAGFSLGTVLAAFLASGMSAWGVPLVAHLGVTVLLILFTVVRVVRGFLPHQPAPAPDDAGQAATHDGTYDATPAAAATTTPAARSAWTEPRTIVIGLVTLVAAFAEGSANDWISVAFIDGHGMPEWAGVLGFATFLTFMTAGRWFGATVLDRHGRVTVLRVLFTTAAVGSLMFVFGGPVLAYAGVAIWGIGVSLGFPVGMSASADDPERAAARLSVVSMIAYSAFLAGPPLLGLLAERITILKALSVVSAMLILALLAVPALREQQSREAHSSSDSQGMPTES